MGMGTAMFLRSTIPTKDSKQHGTWSVMKTHRVAGGKVVKRRALYLGEINDRQAAA